MKGAISCKFYENPSRKWLEESWVKLELCSEHGFFLSWAWISTWLDCFVKDHTVVVAKESERVVGLGILVTQPANIREKHFRRIHHLHRTGVTEYDQIWIECNDFLLVDEHRDKIRLQMINCTLSWMGKWDKLVIGASNERDFKSVESSGFFKRDIWSAPSYLVDFDKLNSTSKTIHQSISRNARYQINRSLKKYRLEGDISLVQATKQDEKLGLLKVAAEYHKLRWGHQSGFHNKSFNEFHTKFIDRAKDSVELTRVQCGSETIAVVYNISYQNRVYFYLSGINYHNNSKHIKPGIVSHYLLIDSAHKTGVACYDFMGGDARYKRTFANVESRQIVFSIEKSRLLYQIGNMLRCIKNKLLERQSGV
ncbi:GNAT family N-acetyltransferase [Vibrio sp. HN007]|uniref:GNAT family N-acetyltransferase n=1 Tax=Vibrio iocasae TaxID=3098914 RepID=UPI0035D4F4B9